MKFTSFSQKRIISLLKHLIQIPTENPPGFTKEIIDYLTSEVLTEEQGFENNVIAYKKNGNTLHNLVSKIGNGETKIIFSGHFDVVPVGNLDDWTVDPFSGKVIENFVYGRGSADMKSGIVALLTAIKSLSQVPSFLDNCTLIFAGTSDEELGMTGAQKLHQMGIMNDASLLIVAEPTKLKIGVAEKGLLWLSATFKGKSAHGSMPHKGVNAIEKAMRFLPNIKECIGKNYNPILGNSTVNIGTIRGGTSINIVADKVTIELDFRLVPEDNSDIIIANLKEIDKECIIKSIKALPALESNIGHKFIKNLKNVAKTEFVGLPYATDAAELIKEGTKIPFVIFGPGNPAYIHKNDERVNIEDVFTATEILRDSIYMTY
jgi:succinyl-diaminopimelate desuccinylase